MSGSESALGSVSKAHHLDPDPDPDPDPEHFHASGVRRGA